MLFRNCPTNTTTPVIMREDAVAAEGESSVGFGSFGLRPRLFSGTTGTSQAGSSGKTWVSQYIL